ncbi:MAG: MerR family transcriptional regulator [Saprospiraceae bacterium]|jgi:DNA-binding transcriptional MerR regulator|nr:MerR family transcriptional regulator [Saprospiraceae bacterium]
MQYPLFTKVYYTIGEAGQLFGIAPSVIRYWEAEFDVLKPSKNTRGERKYTQKDMKLLADIHYLLKDKGFTIEGARKELLHRKMQEKEERLVVNRLLDLKDRLLQIKERMDKLFHTP